MYSRKTILKKFSSVVKGKECERKKLEYIYKVTTK
jgi:hypothetical protein